MITKCIIHTSNEKYISRQNVCTRLAQKTLRDSKKTGFTLIELLVVIAIIALLLSILVPALRIAKEKGSMAVCLYNVRQLSTAWFTYKEDNKDLLVNPDVRQGGWVMSPLRADGVTECKSDETIPVTDEDEKRGIEKGVLFPYVNNFDVYHCPGDNIRRSKYDGSKIFRTYAIPHCLGMPGNTNIQKFSDIKTPGIRYNIVEEAEGRNFNVGTWSFKTPTGAATLGGNDQGWRWQDPIGINHGDSGVLGYCDSHAIIHKWVDPYTKLRIELFFNDPTIKVYGDLETKYFHGINVKFNDLNFMGTGWAYRKFP